MGLCSVVQNQFSVEVTSYNSNFNLKNYWIEACA